MKLILLFLFFLISAQSGLSQPQPPLLPSYIDHADPAISINHHQDFTHKLSINHNSTAPISSQNLWLDECNIEAVEADLCYSQLLSLFTVKVPTYSFTPQPNDTPLLLSMLEYVSLFSNSPPILA